MMFKSNMQELIDHHDHAVHGIRYRFRFQWAALEPRWSSRGARYLLAIEVFADGDVSAPCTTVHVVTRVETNPASLLRLVDDALEDHLAHRRPCAATA
jgi:hypothetical protein